MLGDRVGERQPGDVCSGQPRHRCAYISVNDWRREQAAHLLRCGDLASEPVPEFGLPGQFGPDHLHRDQPPAG